MDIEKNIETVRRRIKDACERSGRNADGIRLIAVSKTVDVDRIREAVALGLKSLGENKVQEIVDKYPQIEGDIEWHMIGHLQTNKVKYIVDKVVMIHSVDSIKLAEEIDKRFGKCNKKIDVLAEINIGREPSKHGIDPDDVESFLNSISKYKYLNICGLMAVAPEVSNTEDARPYFRKMREIFDDIKAKNIEGVNMKYLSMGMTGDFEVAIEEGANIIRVGTGIFGPRNYNLRG